jgi:uncharacterized membrane protein YeaQ/YmgE (transglycosylase-associated protein family)
MKMFKIILIISSFTFLISCSSIPRTVCPEEEYHNLNNIPIHLTTKNVITLVDKIKNNKIKSNGALKNKLFNKYEIEDNFLKVKIGKYQSKIKFINIEKIEFEGVYDKEVGIINETELKNNMGYSGTFYGILFGVVGAFAGAGIANLIYPFRLDDDDSAVILLLGEIIGTTSGGILGNNIGYNSELNSAIEKIKKERIKKDYHFN